MSRPFIPVPDVFKVQMIYSLYNQRCENVFFVKSGTGISNAASDRIESVCAAWWTNTYRQNISSACSLILIVTDALDAAAGQHREYTTGWTAPGIVGGNSLPGGSTTAIKHASSVRGRSYRGRSYVVGVSTSDVSNGLISIARRDALAAAWNTLRTNLAADGGSDVFVVVSFMSNGVWRNEGTVTPIVSSSAHQNIDSQRRRLIGRGL